MTPLPTLRYPPDPPEVGVEWFLRCLIVFGANRVSVDVDGKAIKGIRYSFPGGPERFVDYSNRPARPCLIVGRGSA